MRKFLFGLALWLGALASALAQSTPTPGYFTGLEQLRCTSQSGSACQVLLNHVRDSSSYLLVATGVTVNSTPTWLTPNLIATGAITTWNVKLPNPAADGQIFTVDNSTAADFTSNTSVTVDGTGPQSQTLAVAFTSQTLTAGGGRAQWTYVWTNTSTGAGTWYRTD